ncbi:xanthine dehydrogenase family protein subunit M [Pseudonocardia aurantiaca]|uniref:Xanthine dehydrogenase family protein subunit M n=1 Tax=Pseudonocardia aurantiaca TaxID=75290 RepID=A0ABW4FHB4_9PSEU
MKPPPFRYSAPITVAEAVGLLVEHADDEPRLLAGGQSLVPLMNLRLAQPGHLVDLRRVGELAGIRVEDDAVVLGAMTRQAAVEDSPEVAVAAPLLAEAIGLVAHRPIRNSGTVGGNIAHADPAAELPVVALALDAQMVAAGPGGTHRIPAAEFFLGPFTTSLQPDEILTEVRLRRRGGGHAFVEFARGYGNFAIVAVAAVVEVADGRVASASITLGGVGPTAVRATAAEELLTGAAVAAVDIAAVAEAAVAGLTPAGDVHASAVIRTDLARVHVRRALELSLSRAQDER